MSENIYNPLLRNGFQKNSSATDIKFDDESGSEISLTEILNNLKNSVNTKVDIYQGESNKNMVVVTDNDGNIIVKKGYVMTEDEKEKLNLLTQTMIVKGVKQSEEEVILTPNPEEGWVFFVPGSSNGYYEYCYTKDDGWTKIGTTGVSQRYLNSNKSTVSVGGVKEGSTFDCTFQELFDKIFYPELGLTNFTLATNISGVHEYGEPLTIKNIGASYKPASVNISALRVWTDKTKATLLGEVTNTNNPKIIGLEYQGNTLYGELTDKGSTPTTLKATYSPNFKYPYFHGTLSASEEPTHDKWDYRTMENGELLSSYTSKSYTINLTEEEGYCYFALPEEAAKNVTSIKDGTIGFDYLTGDNPGLRKVRKQINLNYNENVWYYFYVKTVAAKGTFKFVINL